jgi:hypothetical protein
MPQPLHTSVSLKLAHDLQACSRLLVGPAVRAIALGAAGVGSCEDTNTPKSRSHPDFGLGGFLRRVWPVAFAAAFVLAWVSAASAAAATLTVHTTQDETTSGDHLCSLREAIGAANSPGTPSDCGIADSVSNTIMLGAGTYTLSVPPAGTDDNSSGDLNVTGTTPLAIVGMGEAATVIDASGLGDRALSIAAGASVTLQELEITGGHAPDGAAGPNGGGNGSDAGSTGAGGGIYNAGALNVTGSAILTNNAGGGGGGGYGGSGKPGYAGPQGGAGGAGGAGGGIFDAGGAATLTVSNSTIEGNRGGDGGGGGTGYLSRGGGGAGGGAGGGIASQDGRLVVDRSTIADNAAGSGGGGGAGFRSAAGGGSGSSGGGIHAVGGSLQVINSTLAGNDAGNGGEGGSGGAIAAAGVASASVMRNATIANNGAGAGGPDSGGPPGNGGGLDDSTALSLQNTIVASNNANGAANCSPSSGVANGGHDLSYGDASCPGSNANPALSPLADYGGPTETMALAAGSAAIDQVPATGADCPATDQRGVKRPQSSACDIGAFEFAVPQITITSPADGASYTLGATVLSVYRCSEGTITNPIATCHGTVASGKPIGTSSTGTKSFTVTATDSAGNQTTKTVSYTVTN